MSAWDTGSGLQEEYDGKVTDAYFEEGDYGVTLKLVIDSPQLDDEVENWYPCGKKVAIVSDGEVDLSAMRGNLFNSNSGVGQLIKAIKDNGLVDQVGDEGPSVAKSFVGLEAHWELREFHAKINGEERTYTRVLPTGPAEGGKSSDTKDDGEDVPMWLITLASEHSSYDDFVDAALADDRLTRSLRAVVMNEKFWDFS